MGVEWGLYERESKRYIWLGKRIGLPGRQFQMDAETRLFLIGALTASLIPIWWKGIPIDWNPPFSGDKVVTDYVSAHFTIAMCSILLVSTFFFGKDKK